MRETADAVGCDIITATPDVLAKLDLVGKDLEAYSLETVRMFFDDAAAAGRSGVPAARAVGVRDDEALFGLADTPRIARGSVPLTIHLLSPAHRPVPRPG